ncbi:hypothetical protein J6590_043529 [Homalodisca vitripennis]|nr:hypothetical protein J6590_043529 [Homalodisca vitripennis]
MVSLARQFVRGTCRAACASKIRGMARHERGESLHTHIRAPACEPLGGGECGENRSTRYCCCSVLSATMEVMVVGLNERQTLAQATSVWEIPIHSSISDKLSLYRQGFSILERKVPLEFSATVTMFSNTGFGEQRFGQTTWHYNNRIILSQNLALTLTASNALIPLRKDFPGS